MFFIFTLAFSGLSCRSILWLLVCFQNYFLVFILGSKWWRFSRQIFLCLKLFFSYFPILYLFIFHQTDIPNIEFYFIFHLKGGIFSLSFKGNLPSLFHEFALRHILIRWSFSSEMRRNEIIAPYLMNGCDFVFTENYLWSIMIILPPLGFVHQQEQSDWGHILWMLPP